jgi:hypothetical protein
MLILLMSFAPFQPPTPAPRGPATIFPHQVRAAGRILFSGLGGRKAPNSLGKTSTAGVLRLRAIKRSVCDRSAKRFAQDDGFVGG